MSGRGVLEAMQNLHSVVLWYPGKRKAEQIDGDTDEDPGKDPGGLWLGNQHGWGTTGGVDATCFL